MNLGALTCKNCGGRINPATLTCEYCGTHYIDNGAPCFVVMDEKAPVRVLKAEVQVPEEYLQSGRGQQITEWAMADIRQQIAQALEESLEVRMSYNFRENKQIITARCRVLAPSYRF